MTVAVVAVAVITAATFARRAIRAGHHHLVARRLRANPPRPRVRPRWASRTRADAGAAPALPLFLEDVARALRAGASLRGACEDAAAHAPASIGVAPALARAERGVPLAEALSGWPGDRPLAEVHVAAAALVLAADAGGPQARAVDSAAETLRERLAVAAEIRAQSAQARLSALVIGSLPVVFLSWAVLTDRRTAAFLVSQPVGWACLAAGVALEVTGAGWMRRILRSAAP
jgi:tight adherence protein B